MNNKGNYYFETLNRIQGELTEERLVQRMAECNAVLGEISNSQAWQVLVNDTRRLIKDLDDNWQDMNTDDIKFKKAMVLKIACKHIADFPSKYLEELQMIEEKLAEIQNPDKIIQKDMDNDGFGSEGA